MVKQYPDTLNVSSVADSVQDGDGNWVPGLSTASSIPCRAEPSGSDGTVKAEDGARINYDWTIYIPPGQIHLKPGTAVEIVQNGVVVVKDTVKRFSVGQMNSRAWL